MKRLSLSFVFFLLSVLSAFSQDLAGRFYQSYFSGREPYYSSVYSVAIPTHKDGAVLILVHGETVIDRIYILVDKLDLKAFTNAFESCRIQYLSKGRIDDNYFPPVSIYWRDRKRHLWAESSGIFLEPYVYHDGNVSYLSISGNAVSDDSSEIQSGNYFLFLKGPSEVMGLMDILRSDNLKYLVNHSVLTMSPFE